MKIISKNTQWRLVKFLVLMSKSVTPSSFEGTTKEQFDKFDKFTTEVADLVFRVGGMVGLAYAEKKLGISSILERENERNTENSL